MNADCVIVDANIAFKGLASNRGDLRERFGPGRHPQFFTPRFLFVELFKHKDRLLQASGLPEDALLSGLHTLLQQVTFVHENNISLGHWVEAWRLCKDVDEKDTPYVALTLHLDGRLWTEACELRRGLAQRGFERIIT